MPRSDDTAAIRPEMTVRQVAADFPSSQSVFRQYGESPRGQTRFGHLEPLTNYARRRGISLQTLLSELSAATSVPAETGSRYAERVHKLFLLFSLAITLSLGTGWGAWILMSIGRQREFSAVEPGSITAHGEAQLWGFMALFIIGISLRTALQGAVRQRWGRAACRALLILALGGIAGGFVWFLISATLPALGVAAALCLLVMSATYWALELWVLHHQWSATSARAVLTAGMWLIAWAATTVYVRWLAHGGGPGAYTDSQRFLLIELAVFGFAMNSIYGFGQMLLPGFLRLGTPRRWPIELSYWAHNTGAMLVCLSTGFHWSGIITTAGCALLTGGALLFAAGHRGFIGRRRTSSKPEQGAALLDWYPPIAFFWLVASTLLMTGGFLYQSKTGAPLPHAYMGAVRHALTVGFMMTLIMGVAQRILPVLSNTVLAMPRLVLPILVLIGSGNLLRVSSEMAVLVSPDGFSAMSYSALFEWTALVLFTISCVSTMYHRDLLFTRGRVSKRSSLANLLAKHPWIEDRLIDRGMGYLQRARSIPQPLTIGSFAESEGLPADRLVDEINSWLDSSCDPPATRSS